MSIINTSTRNSISKSAQKAKAENASWSECILLLPKKPKPIPTLGYPNFSKIYTLVYYVDACSCL